MRRETLAALATRAGRLFEWEAREGKFSALTATAFNQLLKHLPPEAAGEKDHQGIEEWEFVAKVERMIRERPEVWLIDLEPRVAEEVRNILRAAGVRGLKEPQVSSQVFPGSVPTPPPPADTE